MVLLRLTISSVFVLVYACRSDLQTIQSSFAKHAVAIDHIQIVVPVLKVLKCHQFHCKVCDSLLASAYNAQLSCTVLLC